MKIRETDVRCGCGCHRWFDAEQFPDEDGLCPSCRTNAVMLELEDVLDNWTPEPKEKGKSMKLSEVKSELQKLDSLRFKLPNGDLVPEHFHVT